MKATAQEQPHSISKCGQADSNEAMGGQMKGKEEEGWHRLEEGGADRREQMKADDEVDGEDATNDY